MEIALARATKVRSHAAWAAAIFWQKRPSLKSAPRRHTRSCKQSTIKPAVERSCSLAVEQRQLEGRFVVLTMSMP
eukprot:4042406-Amphidinium_carterae.1